jgi:hypothetical protein
MAFGQGIESVMNEMRDVGLVVRRALQAVLAQGYSAE